MSPLEKPEVFPPGSASGFSSGLPTSGPDRGPLDSVKIYCHGEEATAGFFDGSWLCDSCGERVAVVA